MGFFPNNCVVLTPYRQCGWRRAANDKFVNRAALDAFRMWTREREELVPVICGGVGVWMSKKSPPFLLSSAISFSWLSTTPSLPALLIPPALPIFVLSSSHFLPLFLSLFLMPFGPSSSYRKQLISGVGSLSGFRASFGQFSPVSCTRASLREDSASVSYSL